MSLSDAALNFAAVNQTQAGFKTVELTILAATVAGNVTSAAIAGLRPSAKVFAQQVGAAIGEVLPVSVSIVQIAAGPPATYGIRLQADAQVAQDSDYICWIASYA